MNVSAHREKIARLEALRARLDPLEDFELWFWAGMIAGTHAVNAALHHAGITHDDRMFAMQPGVYLVPRADGSLEPAFRPLGDVLHVGRPKIDGPVPRHIAEMMHAMELVERYRDPCVRQGVEPTRAIMGECSTALNACLALLDETLREGAIS